MNDLRMITFRCEHPLYSRMEGFSSSYELDRTSILKLALHFFLNLETNADTTPHSTQPAA